MNLKTIDEWKGYCKSGKKPDDIPATPFKIYKDKGWKGMGDWLGTGNIAATLREFRSFGEAREFARSLNLKTGDEWRDYCDKGKKPDDIPAWPNQTYKDKGWKGMGDWLGTGNIAATLREFRSFGEAREFARSLNLKNFIQWKEYCTSGKRPDDIPANPDQTYKDKGWISLGDWLGTDNISPRLIEFRTFEKAREFARSLNLKSGDEWKGYCKSGKKPDDIPATPFKVYKDKGWKGMGDWLGTGNIAATLREFRSFGEAREFARSLNLKTVDEWKGYCKSGKKPDDIPATPFKVYKDEGWKGMGDWLGTGNIANWQREYRPFEKAREFARSLNLKTVDEWKGYCKSGKRPEDISTNPNQTYKDKGWISWVDWLGTNTVACNLKEFRMFEEARAYVHSLNLKKQTDWQEYSKSGKRPNDIPSSPATFYKNKGWENWGDWLGTTNIAKRLREYRSFEEARKFVHSLGLKGEAQWREYCTSGKRPDDIPANPDQTYKEKGWKGMGDWVGKNK